MASTDLTPTHPTRAGQRGGPEDPGQGPLIRRPTELVELAELVYRGVFSAGLLAASVLTLFATVLGALQPEDQTAGIAACSLLLLGQLVATHQRRRLYPLLRRWPWLVLMPAVAIGGGAWATGADNQQLFYVLAILLGVLGAAVPLQAVALASLVAAIGMAAPHITDGSWTIGTAAAAGVLPPLFWLVIEQFVRFMLRLHQTNEQPPLRRPKRIRVWQHAVPTPPAASGEESQHVGESEMGEGDAPESRTAGLTARQLEVLLLVAEGLKHGQIGACLQIGPAQVGRHLGSACERAHVATNAELVAWMIRRGLIPSAATDQTADEPNSRAATTSA